MATHALDVGHALEVGHAPGPGGTAPADASFDCWAGPRRALFVSFFLYLVALFILSLDWSREYRWYVFVLHILSLLPLASIAVPRFSPPRRTLASLPFLICIGCALMLRAISLEDYPWVAVWDEVRDGGLHTWEIVTGYRKEIFAYGTYESHGLIIPTLVSVFHSMFPQSALLYRIPAALCGIFEVALLYVTVSKWFGRSAGFWGALVLATTHLHLFFSRTEIVVAFDSLWATAILAATIPFLVRPDFRRALVLGTVTGIASGFHTSARAVALLSLGLAFIHVFQRTARDRLSANDALIICPSLLAAFAIGFGPRVLYTSPAVFLQLRSMFSGGPSPGVITLPRDYLLSLLVYIWEPVRESHFTRSTPILPAFVAPFFLIGIFSAIRRRARLPHVALLYFVLLCPLTNSAITDLKNADNRIAPLWSFAAVTAGIGVQQLTAVIRRRNRLISAVFSIALGGALVYHGATFFTDRVADMGWKGSPQNVLPANFIRIFKNQGSEDVTSLCLRASPANQQYFLTPHMVEQRKFFMPTMTIAIAAKDTLDNYSLEVTRECDSAPARWTSVSIKCRGTKNRACPIGGERNFVLFFEEGLLRATYP